MMGRKGNKDSIYTKFKEEGTEVTEPHSISHAFCEYFTIAREKQASPIGSNPISPLTYINKNLLYLQPTDPNEISRIIISMKSKASTGHNDPNTSLQKKLKLV